MSGCVNLNVHPMPAYDMAIKMGGPERPKLFTAADTDSISAAITPYAQISAFGGASFNDAMREIWHRAAELKADVVVVYQGSPQYTGSVAMSQYVGGGMATGFAVPVYNQTSTGICYRLNPSRIGFRTDKNNMIINIFNDSLMQAGILEGDTVSTVNGNPWNGNGTPELLALKPGQDVQIGVIRPGAGRIIKTVKTVKNEPNYLNFSDPIEWVIATPKQQPVGQPWAK